MMVAVIMTVCMVKRDVFKVCHKEEFAVSSIKVLNVLRVK